MYIVDFACAGTFKAHLKDVRYLQVDQTHQANIRGNSIREAILQLHLANADT